MALLSEQPEAHGLAATDLARALPTARAPALGPMAIMLGASVLLSSALFVVRPIANGHEYQLGVRLTVLLSMIWGACTFRARWLREPRFLAVIFAVGVYCMVSRPLTIKADSEIVAAYGSAFAALDAGKNPYDSGTIVHFAERGERELGNFNYPPLELVPYYAVAKLVGCWDHRVLTATLLIIQLAACALLWCTFPEAPPGVVLAFAPLLSCFELHTNVAFTLLAVAGLMFLLRPPPTGAPPRSEKLLTLAFGASLLTKFMIIPLFASYVVQRLPPRPWRAWRTAAPALGHAAAALLITLGLMLPFGVGNVLRETLLFNLVLSDRAKLTTFYPNVLSGTLTWLGAPAAFPALAVLLLGAAVLYSRRLGLVHAMLSSGTVFLLVSPTPELQYIPVMVYLALWAALDAEFPRAASAQRPATELRRAGQQRSD